MDSPAQIFAAHLMAALSDLGIAQVFASPGSRSQSLVVAAQQLHDADRLTLRMRVDERSMAFTALGASRATSQAIAIITTSGTAVSNLHPAISEAHHSGIPLILLTADRPKRLRGVGANQTTNQVGIFADAVRECFDVEVTGATKPEQAKELAERAMILALGLDGDRSGPVQLNLCFDEPLSASEPNAGEIQSGASLPRTISRTPKFEKLDGLVKTVVVAGADAGFEAIELAEAYGWPVFAEPSSRARFGANTIAFYPALLQNTELTNQIQRVVIFGKPTLSRTLLKLISEKEQVAIRSKTIETFNLFGNATIVDEVTVVGETDSSWLHTWREASSKWAESQPANDLLDRRSVIEAVYQASEFDDSIVLGASRTIREADLWAPVKPLQVFSNRGLSGIDGTIATATGVALNAEGAMVRAVIGDLTLIHDASSMIEDLEEDLNLQLVVINDGGGTIFETLEVANSVSEEIFQRIFKTPQRIDLWSLANAYGFSYFAPSTKEQLSAALEETGRVLIDIKL
ncbi:MAG: 2-succinyl-5-enolpyruvyl-6-hydroxy-3-cyclohexene-1-carboxylic-acid synthase [Actinomycetota bacterium]